MKRLDEVLGNNGKNYILPFLWMRGEPHEIIREELDKIAECGIREVCLESRPHPDYCGPHWWEDVDFIISEAKKKGMRVWILDDDKFPTGHANGAFEKKFPELSKLYLAERHMDVIGPVKNGVVLIKPFLGRDGKLVSVLACPKSDTETLDISPDGIIDLTANIYNGFVYFDLPKGRYRIFVLFTTRHGGGRENYVNLIDSDSVRVLIDEVYEKHYMRYRDEFGKTLAGFFSDEPELGNTPGYDFHETLGKGDVRLPWSNALERALRELWGEDFEKNLPALWYRMGGKTVPVRSQYMDQVTRLVRECFSEQLGKWCEEHNVEYIGHVIEDDNAHARLGCSIGHYFREQKGQHMSGVDVVHFQILPGFNEKVHRWLAWETDGEFFHYGLAKLGSSCAHIDPKKQGRAVCEIFGNYGWAEGIRLMKWLTDHMLVRGINHFVPHAFSPKFPDRDCPPHFYARGNNPCFRFFAHLMRYMNRVGHLLNGGTHITDAAVLYHAEAEWTGEEAMLFQKPVRKLLEAQLDCDVIPADIFDENHVRVENGKLYIHKQQYGSLIIPGCRCIPVKAAEFVINAVKQGLPVYITGTMPETDTLDRPLPDDFKKSCTVLELENLSETIRKNQKTEISLCTENKELRFLCYKHEDGILYLFFNESVDEKVDTEVIINNGSYSHITRYDAVNNLAYNYRLMQNRFRLVLEPGESAVFIPGSNLPEQAEEQPVCTGYSVLDCDWTVSTAAITEYPDFKKVLEIPKGGEMPNLNGPGYFPEFSGFYRYEGSFIVNVEPGARLMLRFPRVNDCAVVYVNGKEAGCFIGSPNRLDITGFVKPGVNDLMVDVNNTLVWQIQDGASTQMLIEPTGITERPVLETYTVNTRG